MSRWTRWLLCGSLCVVLGVAVACKKDEEEAEVDETGTGTEMTTDMAAPSTDMGTEMSTDMGTSMSTDMAATPAPSGQ